ncbi:MAG TPA: hypothetical protein VMW65_16760 [Chloroflexota bacterium]|nr:hypothetical protein [Chloroflexota bacterium]
MRSRSGLILTVTGFLACPCHLPLTLPLLLTLLGGTSLGFLLRHNTGLVFAAAGVYFLVAIGIGLFLLNRGPSGDDSSLCCSIDQPTAASDARPGAGFGGALNTPIRM